MGGQMGGHGGRARRSRVSVVAVALAVSMSAVAVGPSSSSPAAAAMATARFVPLPPKRILDTRAGLGRPGTAPVTPQEKFDLQVTGSAVPPGAVAVAFNLTITGSLGGGYVTAWPAGTAMPTVSNVNVTGPGQTVANLAVVRLPASGKLSLYTFGGGHLLADVAGYWLPATSARDGRFVANAPTRVLDTRSGLGAPIGPLGAGRSLSFSVLGLPGLPVAGVKAVVLTVTATQAAAGGYVTAYPGGTPPDASVLNLPGPGSTVPNLVIVPIGSGGKISLFSYQATHLIADVSGYFTDATGSPSADGLFVPLPPGRTLDTRAGTPWGTLWPGQRNDLVVHGTNGVPTSGVAAVVANLTATEPMAGGYVTAWPAVTTQPETSNLNLAGPGATVASLAMVGLGPNGAISLWGNGGTEMIADIAGYFTGVPRPADPGVPATPPAPPAPPLLNPPTAAPTPRLIPCDAGPPMAQIKRVNVNPGLEHYLDNIAAYPLQQLAYTFMMNSGPLPARVASDPEFTHWIERFSPISGRSTFMTALNIAYHETIHMLQAGRCAITGPTTGYPTPRVGFAQSEIYVDVNARIDAIATLSGADAFTRDYPHAVADTYLLPGTLIAQQGFASQMWEINAYVLAAEWGAKVNDVMGVDYLGDTSGNDDTMSIKFHQLARYLNRATANPTAWAQLQGYGLPQAVADHWNLGMRSWQVYKTPYRAARFMWDLAFGPDATPIITFTGGAAGTTAPPRP